MISAAEQPLLAASGLTKYYGAQLGCRDVSLDLYEGEVMAVVGESGSGKSTLLQLLSGQIEPGSGEVRYRTRDGQTTSLWEMSEPARRFLYRTDWGFVHQDPQRECRRAADGGRMAQLRTDPRRRCGLARSSRDFADTD